MVIRIVLETFRQNLFYSLMGEATFSIAKTNDSESLFRGQRDPRGDSWHAPRVTQQIMVSILDKPPHTISGIRIDGGSGLFHLFDKCRRQDLVKSATNMEYGEAS